ncbi:hypothetical protein [Dinoroseobacter sp. S375]|uniref:hypothetical protein n=1 Tax=Dinoroseobacter sp. S375 TaxID=3415136 RepID=UPI003C7CB0FD
MPAFFRRPSLAIGLALSLGALGAASESETNRVTCSFWCPHVCTDANEVLLPEAPGFATEPVRDRLVDQVYEVLFAPQPFAGQFKDITLGARTRCCMSRKHRIATMDGPRLDRRRSAMP